MSRFLESCLPHTGHLARSGPWTCLTCALKSCLCEKDDVHFLQRKVEGMEVSCWISEDREDDWDLWGPEGPGGLKEFVGVGTLGLLGEDGGFGEIVGVGGVGVLGDLSFIYRLDMFITVWLADVPNFN